VDPQQSSNFGRKNEDPLPVESPKLITQHTLSEMFEMEATAAAAMITTGELIGNTFTD
jgi:hypothetical protein